MDMPTFSSQPSPAGMPFSLSPILSNGDCPTTEEASGVAISGLQAPDILLATSGSEESASESSASTPPPSARTEAESDEDVAARLQREEEESIQLARALMAEEAMASYEHHFYMLRESMGNQFMNGNGASGQGSDELVGDSNTGDHLGEEERRAWQVALEEEEIEQNQETDDSYEELMRLGETIGDVKAERWALIAAREVAKLPTLTFPHRLASERQNQQSETDTKCLVCQCEYDPQETLRELPCKHCFHQTCVDQWLATKDFCPYCRQSIVPDTAMTSDILDVSA